MLEVDIDGDPGGLVNASLSGTKTSSWWINNQTGDALNWTAYDEPNLRTVVVTLGAQDILSFFDSTDVEDHLTELMSSINAYCVKNYRRSDGSFIHIVLATVPPLGLDPTDERELNRQQLNTDIRNNFVSMGADDIVDFERPFRTVPTPTTSTPSISPAPPPTPPITTSSRRP